MATILTILWAYIRCHCYLLFKGMWKGEQQVTMYHNDKLLCIAAGKGSLSNFDLVVTRLFYSVKSDDYWRFDRNK